MAGVPPPEVSVAASRCAGGVGGIGGPLALVCINDALPQELIGLVLRKLSDLVNFGRARCVCKTWHQLTSSPSYRPPSALWCLIQCGYDRLSELRIFDLFSGKDYKMEVPVANFTIKGQGGLIALRSYVGYWIGNPLLTKWAQVDMRACCRSGSYWQRGAWELVIDRAQDGSSSYKLVQFMYIHDPHMNTVRLGVDIYDSRSRVWTAGSTLECPHPLGAGQWNRLELQSCVWSGRIYLLMSVTAFWQLHLPNLASSFSILEYSVEKDTLTMMVPSAFLPMSREEGQTLSWHGVFQVEVREDYYENGSSKVQLVVAEPSSTGNRPSPKPVQVFAWDQSLGRWVVKVQPEVAQSDDPDSNGLRFWRDPWPEDQDLTSLGFLVRDRQEAVYWPREVPPELAYSAVSVCRTDTLAEWHCEFRTTSHDKAFHGHCFFPNFHDQP